MRASAGTLLLQHCSEKRITLMPPATAAEIKTFERDHAIQLPGEIRDYYLSVGGFAPSNEQDLNGFSFWPLGRIHPVATFEAGRWSAKDTAGCFLFADYLSLSWGYALDLAQVSLSARVCIVGTANRRPIWIADDLRQFVELYISDDKRLYPVDESRL